MSWLKNVSAHDFTAWAWAKKVYTRGDETKLQKSFTQSLDAPLLESRLHDANSDESVDQFCEFCSLLRPRHASNAFGSCRWSSRSPRRLKLRRTCCTRWCTRLPKFSSCTCNSVAIDIFSYCFFFLSFPLSFFLTVFLFLLCFVHKQKSGCLTRAHAWKWGGKLCWKGEKSSLEFSFPYARFLSCWIFQMLLLLQHTVPRTKTVSRGHVMKSRLTANETTNNVSN